MKLGEGLGRGAFGGVFGTDVHNLAVKLGSGVADESVRQFVRLPAHENVVKVFPATTSESALLGASPPGGAIYKRLRGGELQKAHKGLEDDYLAGAITPHEFFGAIQLLGVDIMSGVAHLHRHGIWHGDIHPKNVMLGHIRSRAHLIDIEAFASDEGTVKGNWFIGPSPEVFNYLREERPEWVEESQGQFGERVFAGRNLAGAPSDFMEPSPTGARHPAFKLDVNAAGRLAYEPLGCLTVRDRRKLGPFWAAAREFARQMTLDPDQRPTADEALRLPFMTDLLIERHYASALIKRDIATIERFRDATNTATSDQLEQELEAERASRSRARHSSAQ